MTRVDIGDGGPPIDIPDQWMPDWQTHLRDVIARGHAERDLQRSIRKAEHKLRTNASIAAAAAYSGLPADHVARIAARLEAKDFSQHGTDLDAYRKILGYPVRDDDPLRESLVDPSQWPTRRNLPHRIRILHAGDPPPHHGPGECGLPVIRITITPIEA